MDINNRPALVAECRASGMTAKAWCEANGIDYRRYVIWATKVNREKQHAPQQWADVTIKQEEHISDKIRLSCGKWTIYVESGFNPTLLADILRVVGEIC